MKDERTYRIIGKGIRVFLCLIYNGYRKRFEAVIISFHYTEIRNGKPIHVVCGKEKDVLAVITVYIPMPPKFITPYERG